MTTLSVDDNRSVTVLMVSMMRRIDPTGIHLSAGSAEKAFEIMAQEHIDIVFLDIEMPKMSGIDAARIILRDYPGTNVIFLTGHAEYALDAHSVFASGFLRKPVMEDDIRETLEHLRYPIDLNAPKKLRVICFGSFAVFSEDMPVTFNRAKTMELFAYLVYKRGAMCSMGELTTLLWGGDESDASKRSYLRKLIQDLRLVLEEHGAGDVINKEWNSIGIMPDELDCDYFEYLNGSKEKKNQYRGVFMDQYPWATFS